MTKTAVVLFNLGGPDSQQAVAPFLFNLFKDPAILRLPQPFRSLLARWISKRRAPSARAIYAQLGGGSPILSLTEKQAAALSLALEGDSADHEYRVFIAMRYWHPFSDETAARVKEWSPDRIVLLPLYPQFSTTTTGSSLKAWEKAAKKAGINVPSHAICCYPLAAGFQKAVAGLLRQARAGEAEGNKRARVLFSAHGLPKKIIAAGDPYEWQVNETVKGIVAALGDPALDWAICYQSRVGPLEWIGPSLDSEIDRAARDGVPVIVVPVVFVSEHSETLVELDITYRALAEKRGVPAYTRVPAVGTEAPFIQALAGLVHGACTHAMPLGSEEGGRICPRNFSGCLNQDTRTET